MEHTNDNSPACVLSTQLSMARDSVVTLILRWTKGHRNPFVNMTKTGWRFSPDLQVPFTITLDSGKLDFGGLARVYEGKSYVTSFEAEEIADMLDDLASSDKFVIGFNGTEPQWTFRVGGLKDAVKSFRSCVKSMQADEKPTSPVPDVSDEPTSPVPGKKPKNDKDDNV